MAQVKTFKFDRTMLQGAAGRWAAITVIALSATTVGMAAWAHGGPGDRAGAHAGMRGAGAFGPGLFGGPPQRIERAIDRMLDGVNATDAQRVQIKKIALATATDLKAQHEANRGLPARGAALFTAPQVDAAAVEQLRQQMVAQHDQMSRRTTQALVDMSRVLTPEQRATLAERMKNRMARGDKRHHDGPPPSRPGASGAEPRPAS